MLLLALCLLALQQASALTQLSFQELTLWLETDSIVRVTVGVSGHNVQPSEHSSLAVDCNGCLDKGACVCTYTHPSDVNCEQWTTR